MPAFFSKWTECGCKCARPTADKQEKFQSAGWRMCHIYLVVLASSQVLQPFTLKLVMCLFHETELSLPTFHCFFNIASCALITHLFHFSPFGINLAFFLSRNIFQWPKKRHIFLEGWYGCICVCVCVCISVWVCLCLLGMVKTADPGLSELQVLIEFSVFVGVGSMETLYSLLHI